MNGNALLCALCALGGYVVHSGTWSGIDPDLKKPVEHCSALFIKRRWRLCAQGAPAAPAEPCPPLPLPIAQGILPLPACDPCPACVSAQSSDEHRGGGVGGTRVQRPAERGVGGAFRRMMGPRLHALRRWGLRSACKQCPRDAWMSRLPAGSKPHESRAGPRRVARVSLRAVARSTVARGCRLLRPRACDAKLWDGAA